MDTAPTEPSRITILRAPGRHLTKSYGRDRNDKIIKRSYDNPKWFHAEVREFNGIDGLADQLRSLQGQTDRCVIRALPGGHFPEDGKPVRRLLHPEEELVDGRGSFHPVAIDPAARARQDADIAAGRLYPVCAIPMFEEVPSSWLLLDFDKIMAPAGVEWRKDPAWTAQFLRMQLPAEFHNVRCCYYATSSAVDPTKPDLGGPEIKMRLGFCLDRGVTAVEGKRWLRDTGLDTCTLNPVQIIYTARPVFSGGLVDPMAVRLGVLDGDHDLVAVPQINVPPHQEFQRTVFGPARSAEGLGLKPSPGLDAALERLGESEGVRDKLVAAAFAYARDVGRDRVDVAALVAALAEAAAPYRSSAEIDGYGLPGMIAWVLQRTQEPISGGLDAYFQGGDTDPAEASATLTLAVSEWVEQGLSYAGKGAAPRHAIAGAAGLGKTTVTLKVLADIAQGRTIHYYSPRLDLGDEVVAIARSEGLDAVLIRGREGSDKQPERFPPLCLRLDVVKALVRAGQPVWQSACRNVDEDGTVNQCGDFGRCGYPRQFDGLEGKLIVLAHEWLTLPKTLLPKADLVIIDERFHTTVVAHTDLPLSRVASPRPIPLGGGHFRQLSADAARAIAAVEAGKTMAEIGLSPERLKEMAKDEVRLADPPTIKPGMDYVEQQRRARKLKETECFKLAKLWRVLAQDHDRLSQRVVVARGIEWKGELQDRVFVHKAKDLVLAKGLPVLVLDADHDSLIGAATMRTTKRIQITPRLNVEVTQVRNTVCSRNKLLETANRRHQILALARQEVAQGRKVLIGTYLPVAELLRAENDNPNIEIAHFGAVRGLDCWKGFDSVIVAGREQPAPQAVENTARALFGTDPERLLLTGEYVQQSRGYALRDGSRVAVTVEVHPDLRVQACLEQVRERETEQMVARLRVVHRDRPARVFLLSNVPTALVVDRLVIWDEVMPTKLAQAIVAGHGVLPLSYAELARMHPGLWDSPRAARHSLSGKGAVFPIRESYWESVTLSAATEVRYRPPGQVRGSPQSAIIPGEVADPQAAATALEVALGPVEAVQIVETFYRPSASAVVAPATVVEDAGEPAPLVVPFPVPPRVHVLDVAEAWAVGPDRLEHWNLHSGHDCLMPPELGRDVQLAVNIGHPTSFAVPPTAPIPLQQDTFLPQALWADDNAAAASRPSGSRLICEHCRHFHRDPGPKRLHGCRRGGRCLEQRQSGECGRDGALWQPKPYPSTAAVAS